MSDQTKNAEAQPFNAADFWQQQYAEASGGGNTFLFFKAERTRVRLIGIGEDPREWMRQVESDYRGQKSPKFLVKGYEIPDPKNPTEPFLQAIVFTKGTWATICNLMMEGYDLFSPEGLGLTVVRSNAGGRISYDVMASPKPVAVSPAIATEAVQTTWEFYLAEFAKMQENRQQGQGQGGGQPNALADQIVNAPSAPNEW